MINEIEVKDPVVVCPHTETTTKVVGRSATCETTVTVCAKCGDQLDEPKTDC